MKKRLMALILAAAMIAVLFAGCSSKTTQDSKGTEPTGTTGGSEEKKPVTIKMVSTIMSENPEGGLEQEVIKKYEEKTGNKVELVSINANDVVKTLIAQANSGNMPDIVTMATSYLGQFVDMDMLADVTEVYGKEYVDGFVPSALDYCKYEDKVYCVPYFFQYTGLLYRKDWFEKEGIKVPTTWVEFLDAAQKLTADTDKDGQVDRWGFAMVGTNNGSAWGRFFPLYATFGVKSLYQDPSKKWVSDAAKPETKEALQMFTDLVLKYNAVPAGPLETSYKEALSLMGSSKTGMMITGTHSLGAIVAASGGQLTGDELAVAPLPKGKSGQQVSTIGVQLLALNKDSKVLKEAADYLKFWNEKENSLNFLSKTGRLPTRTDVLAEAKAIPAMEAMLNAKVDLYYADAAIPAVNDVNTAYGEAWQAIITKSKTVDQATEELIKKVDEIISTIEE